MLANIGKFPNKTDIVKKVLAKNLNIAGLLYNVYRKKAVIQIAIFFIMISLYSISIRNRYFLSGHICGVRNAVVCLPNTVSHSTFRLR